MNITNNILKACLGNVYFINGTAYAGKSTMVRMLAEKHNMIHCGENYHSTLADGIATPEAQPNISYFRTMSGWQEFIGRTPDEYERWIMGTTKEVSEFEIVMLLQLATSGRKIIVDTNLEVEDLREVSDYRRVAIMLSPQRMSVDRFFDREDADKQFLLQQIQLAEDPEKAMENFRACMARINSQERYDQFDNSGFFTLYREETDKDTRYEVMEKLERHFGLVSA